MKRMHIPKAKSFSIVRGEKSGPWGLVEFVLQWVLGMPENFTSAASATIVGALAIKMDGYVKRQGGGEEIILTDEEHEFLVQRWPIAMQRFAETNEARVISPHLLGDFAEYSRALYTAWQPQPAEAPTNGPAKEAVA